MEFQEGAVEQFLEVFEVYKARIRHFPGVRHLELHRDAGNPTVFYTYSHWDSEAALDAYRGSALFGEVWPQTKALFAAKPMAFSLVKEMEVG